MHKTQTIPIVAVLALLGAQGEALAAPSGAKLAGGNASVANNQIVGSDHIDTLVTQVSDRAILDWESFDIAPGELVRFVQNGADAVTLNRIAGDATQILGSLQANGKLFLVNPNGIVFGSSAQVDVAGLVATTFDIANEDFMSGELAFEQAAMNDAEVRNQGTITIGDNGFAYLVAPNVDNTGEIVANLGQVGLAADGNYTLDLQGTELIKFSVAPEVLENSARSVTNSGDLVGETVVLAAQGTETVLSSVVNDGNIQAATSFAMTGDRLVQAGRIEAGNIALDGENSVQQGGDMVATGRVDVDAGDNIAMAAGSITQADGDIRYNVDGDMQVANLTSKSGYIGLVADGSVTQTGDIVTEGTSVEVIAGTEAAGGPGSIGDIVMAEGTRTQAVDDIRYTAGRDLTVETLVSQPDDNIELRAGRTIYQNADITAAGQVDVDAGADIAMAAGTTTRADGDIRYNADGDMQIANLTSKNGYIGLVADGSVTQTGNITTEGTSVEVIAGTEAAGGPDSMGDIVMAEGTRTQAADDIRYTAGRDLTAETLVSQPDDSVELTAGRSLYQHAEITAAGSVDAVAGEDLVMARGAQTQAGGHITYRAGGALHVARLDTRNVSLTTERGTLTAVKGVERNVTASQLEARAAQGIGASGAPLNTHVVSLNAAGGNGGVYIDNQSASLTVTGLNATGGELALRTAGDLTTLGDVTNSGGGSLYMAVGGDMQQQAGLTVSGAGNVTVSGGNVAMAEMAGTTAEQGDIVYRANESLTVSRVSTSNHLVGGRIVLDAPVLTSNASSAGQVQGAFVRVASQSDDEDSLLYMLGDPSEATRIVVNQRTAGGQVAEESSRFADSLRTSTGQVTSRIDEAGMAPVSLEKLNIHYSTEGTAAGSPEGQ